MNMFEEVWPGWNLGKSDVGVAKIKEAGGGGGLSEEFRLPNMHEEGGILSSRIKIWNEVAQA